MNVCDAVEFYTHAQIHAVKVMNESDNRPCSDYEERRNS